MKITSIENCDAGWRTLSFLKIESDDGNAGRSEYNESYGNVGLTTIIDVLGEKLIGADPRRVERIDEGLRAGSRIVQG